MKVAPSEDVLSCLSFAYASKHSNQTFGKKTFRICNGDLLGSLVTN